MIENVSTQLTVFHCLCPLPASRKGLRLTLRSALLGEGGRDWRPWRSIRNKTPETLFLNLYFQFCKYSQVICLSILAFVIGIFVGFSPRMFTVRSVCETESLCF